jgi:hypothetical protein
MGPWFGEGLAMSADGKWLVVGATEESSSAIGINMPHKNDSTLYSSGAAYLFFQEGTTWIQADYLKSDKPVVNGLYGMSVSLSANGGTLLVTGENQDYLYE